MNSVEINKFQGVYVGDENHLRVVQFVWRCNSINVISHKVYEIISFNFQQLLEKDCPALKVLDYLPKREITGLSGGYKGSYRWL